MFSQFITVSSRPFLIEEKKHRICFDAQGGRVVALEEDAVKAIMNGDSTYHLSDQIIDSPFGPHTPESAKQLIESVLDHQEVSGKRGDGSSIVVMVTSQCNLACGYCGQEHRAGNMSRVIEDAVLRRVGAKVSRIPAGSTLNVSWFGGEPLLGLKTIERLSTGISELCAIKGVKWKSKMPSNGILLTAARLQSLYELANLRYVEVTLDGPQDIHDKSRPLRRYKGHNFAKIVDNLTEICALESVPEFTGSIRVNVHAGNIDHVPELLDQIADLGICRKVFCVNLAAVYDWGGDVAEGKIQRSRFAAWELDMCKRMEMLGIQHSLFSMQPIKACCTATNTESEVIATNGRIFTCTEEPLASSLDPSRSVAHILTLAPSDARPKGKFDDWVSDGIRRGRSACARCAVLPLCGGSCPKQWQEGNVPCPPWKFNLDERLTELGVRLGLTMIESE